MLIARTPKGCVCFVSKAGDGRTSDKYLTEHCGILKLKFIEAWWLVIADRWITIEGRFSLYQATFATPTFAKGKAQLDPISVWKDHRNKQRSYSCKKGDWLVKVYCKGRHLLVTCCGHKRKETSAAQWLHSIKQISKFLARDKLETDGSACFHHKQNWLFYWTSLMDFQIVK